MMLIGLNILGVVTHAAAASSGAAAAESTASAAPDAVHTPFFEIPAHWPGQGDLLQWCQTMNSGTAALLILAGIVYLLSGYYIYKWLVTLNAALLGAYIGAVIGSHWDGMVAGAIVGGFSAAALTWTMMKYAVAVMGGVFGALLGASIWRQIGLDPAFAWSGATTGLVAFGLIAFILFRGSIIMYTSLQGSVMLVFGLLGLIYKYQDVGPKITSNMTVKPFILPLCVFIPAMIGLIYQQSRYPEGEKK